MFNYEISLQRDTMLDEAQGPGKPESEKTFKEIMEMINEMKEVIPLYISEFHKLREDYDLLEKDRDNWKQKYQELYEKINPPTEQ